MLVIKYKEPLIETIKILTNYNWPGNIRQLRNFVAQLSVIEKERMINDLVIKKLLPENSIKTPIIFNKNKNEDLSEREILYKVLFDMKRELNELKKNYTKFYNMHFDSIHGPLSATPNF